MYYKTGINFQSTSLLKVLAVVGLNFRLFFSLQTPGNPK